MSEFSKRGIGVQLHIDGSNMKPMFDGLPNGLGSAENWQDLNLTVVDPLETAIDVFARLDLFGIKQASRAMTDVTRKYEARGAELQIDTSRLVVVSRYACLAIVEDDWLRGLRADLSDAAREHMDVRIGDGAFEPVIPILRLNKGMSARRVAKQNVSGMPGAVWVSGFAVREQSFEHDAVRTRRITGSPRITEHHRRI